MLMGPPGSGKGTQAGRIARRLSIPHISTGDILRSAVKAGTPLGRRVGAVMSQGEFVSDALITDLVRERLALGDAAGGFVLDGYPRTRPQADTLDGMRPPDSLMVILIEVPAEAIVARLSSRRLCDACSITQSVSADSDPDRQACPYCGGNLVRRDDDHPDTVRRRLATYAEAAAPVVEFYRERPQFTMVDGLQHADRVTTAILARIADRCGSRPLL